MGEESTEQNGNVTEEAQDRAILVGVFQGPHQREECHEHLAELALLAETFGAEVVAKVPCPVRKFDSGTFVGKGKVEELVEMSQAMDATIIIFDDDILPSQQRNLEAAFGLSVMDRTELILEVFNQRAQTREARLQVDLARIRYQFPRLKRLWTHLHRQRGGGLAVKGEGEKQIELDRRMLQKKLEKVERDLVEVRQHRHTQRQQRLRSDTPIFALIGYTNAGKSTLMNALTDAGAFAEDKLFATLDTTTRKFILPNKQEALLIDTVGFIRKLPHLLVAAFKSTLEESMFADFLLHVIDASHPEAEKQAQETLKVLKELNVEDRPIMTVLNKVDRCQEDPSMLNRLRIAYPRTVQVSALTGDGIEELLNEMVEELKKQRRLLTLRIPQSEYALTSEVMREGQVLSTEYDGNDVILRAEVPVVLAGKLGPYAVETTE